jgi:hypothetical protein
MTKIIKIKKFPLESEVFVRQGQFELDGLGYEELLTFSKMTLSLVSQLTHYSGELINALESSGFKIEPEG